MKSILNLLVECSCAALSRAHLWCRFEGSSNAMALFGETLSRLVALLLRVIRAELVGGSLVITLPGPTEGGF